MTDPGAPPLNLKELEARIQTSVLTTAEGLALLRALRETRAALLRIANWQPAALAGFPKLQGEAEAFYDLREFAAAALRAGEEPLK
jgi:hypothetical protein